MDLVEACKGNDFAFDVFKDTSGSLGLAVFVDGGYHYVSSDDEGFLDIVSELLATATRKVCFDARKLYDLKRRPIDVPLLYDLTCLYSWDGTIHQLAKEKLGPDQADELREKDRRFGSHIRACKIAKVDLRKNPIMTVVPPNFVHSLLKIRTLLSLRLLELAISTGLDGDYVRDRWPLYSRLLETERFGVKLDVVRLEAESKLNYPIHIEKWIRGALQTSRDGFIYTRFSPATTKTGRLRSDGRENSFNLMGVPHGLPREMIVSRFESGRVGVVDYNAIDYRCIVASVDDAAFVETYEECEDFHAATCKLLFGTSDVTAQVRDAVKQLTYISIYGGSPETVSEKTGLSIKNVHSAVQTMSVALKPIHDFRDKLYERSKADGFVTCPGGRQIKLDDDDHPGKVLGLYAQTYSSLLFEMAFVEVFDALEKLNSKVMFTVHDEMVIDIHPDDGDVLSLVKANMEQAADGLRAKAKEGVSYEAAQ